MVTGESYAGMSSRKMSPQMGASTSWPKTSFSNPRS